MKDATYIELLVIGSFIFLPLIYKRYLKKNQWYYPFGVFLLTFCFYFIGNLVTLLVNYWLFQNVYGNPSPAASTFVVGFICILIGYHTPHFHNKPRKWAIWNTQEAFLLYIALVIIGYLGAAIWFKGFTSIPILAKHKDLARIALSSVSRGYPTHMVLQMINAFSISFLIFMHTKGFGRTFLFALMALVALLPLLGWGSRTLILMPFASILLLYANFRKKMKLKWAVLGSCLALAVGVAFICFRGYGTVNVRLYIKYVIGDLFPEMRALANIIPYYKPGDLFHQVYISPIVGLFPKEIFTLFGANKETLWLTYGGAVTPILTGASNVPGVRLSLFGELYLGGGWFGVALSCFILGVILKKFDLVVSSNTGNFTTYPYIITSLPIALLIPHGMITIANCLSLFLGGYVVMMFLRSFRSRTKN